MLPSLRVLTVISPVYALAVYDSTRVRTQVYGKTTIYIMILVLLPGARGSMCLVCTVAKVADYSGCVQPDSGARQINHRPGRGRWQARSGH